MVIVFLVRHAHAVDEAPGLPDASRHLSLDGRAAARQLGERLRWYDCAPTRVLTSPATRAVQTAELVLAGMGWRGLVESAPALAPEADPPAAQRLLTGGAADDQLMVFGHEPGLSALGGLLTRRADFPAIHKAQAVRLEDVAALRGEGRGPMRLRWVFGWGDDAPFPAPAA
jgi:phosphohistidine phosphatase